MIRNELRKCVLSPKNYIVFVVLLFVLAIVTSLNVLPRQQAQIDFYDKLGGPVTYEELVSLSDEYHELYDSAFYYENEQFVNNKQVLEDQGNYLSTKAWDMYFLGKIEKIKKCFDERKTNIEVIKSASNRMDSFYSDDEGIIICDREVITYMLGNKFYPIIACIITILVVSSFMTVELKNKLVFSLCGTKKGFDCVVFRKIILSGVLAFLISLSSLIVFLVVLYIKTGFSIWELRAPAFIVDKFSMCPSGLTVYKFLIIEFTTTVLLACFMAMVTMTLEVLIEKWTISALVSSFIIGVAYSLEAVNKVLFYEGFDTNESFIISQYSFARIYEIVKNINPLSLIDISFYFEQPRFWSLSFGTVDVYFFNVLFTSIGIIVFAIILFKCVQYPKRKLKC